MGNCQNKEALSDTVDLDHFKLNRSIGFGSYGRVRLIKHRQSKTKYALKYFSKEDIIKAQMTINIIRERNILERIDHPFLCSMRFAFQDDYNIYLVLDLKLGGDLRFHCSRRKFDEEEITFILAEVILGLFYLHQLRIVHRDIKPDNILMDERGHIAITDFNSAAIMKNGEKLLDYVAPEMVQGQEYDYAIDWWSLGITLYELIYGTTPFRQALKVEKNNQAVAEQPIDWNKPSHLTKNSSLNDFAQQLLIKDPKARLGAGVEAKDYLAIESHSCFSKIDWDEIESCQSTPPFQPELRKKLNFDESVMLREHIAQSAPLELMTKKRYQKSLEDMSPELRFLTERFRYYEKP